MSDKFEGVLEIDSERGVIYFHLSKKEDIQKLNTITMLRICNLPKPIPKLRFMDITHMHGTNWGQKDKHYYD